MSDLVLYGLKSCDTCRKAMSELRAAGREPDFRDLRDGGMEEIVERAVAKIPLEDLVNRRSTTWRTLDEPTRTAALEPASAGTVLRSHPALMKRPLIANGDELHVGWTDKVRGMVL